MLRGTGGRQSRGVGVLEKVIGNLEETRRKEQKKRTVDVELGSYFIADFLMINVLFTHESHELGWIMLMRGCHGHNVTPRGVKPERSWSPGLLVSNFQYGLALT